MDVLKSITARRGLKYLRDLVPSVVCFHNHIFPDFFAASAAVKAASIEARPVQKHYGLRKSFTPPGNHEKRGKMQITCNFPVKNKILLKVFPTFFGRLMYDLVLLIFPYHPSAHFPH